MSVTNTKDQLPFFGFLTPKRDPSDRLAPVARRSTAIGEEIVAPHTYDSRVDSSSAILTIVEPVTPDSRLLGSQTPEGSSSSRWSSGDVIGYPANYNGGEGRGFETPARRLHPGRTFLQERMFGDMFDSSPGSTVGTPTAAAGEGGEGGAEFLSPERDWGKRGRPRADEITSLIMEGSQSGSNIKCHICSRLEIDDLWSVFFFFLPNTIR